MLNSAGVRKLPMPPHRSSRSIISNVSPPITCRVPVASNTECHMLTNPQLAVPPSRFCFSTRITRAPSRAARTAANTPVQLPPITQTSASAATFTCSAGIRIVSIL